MYFPPIDNITPFKPFAESKMGSTLVCTSESLASFEFSHARFAESRMDSTLRCPFQTPIYDTPPRALRRI